MRRAKRAQKKSRRVSIGNAKIVNNSAREARREIFQVFRTAKHENREKNSARDARREDFCSFLTAKHENREKFGARRAPRKILQC
jgi:hypothetical protein